jgi:WD40 repeat protein
MRFSPDGRFIAVGMKDQTFRVFSAYGHEEVARLENGATEVGLSNTAVTAVSFSADGKYVAVVNGQGIAKMYDLQSATETPGNQHSDSTAFREDQRIIASSSDMKYLAIEDSNNTVQVIEASSQRQIGRYHHEDSVIAAAFSANDRYLATASLDHSTRIWQVDNGREIARITHAEKVRVLALSPDGTLLATKNDPYTAEIWRVSDGREMTRLVCDRGPSAMDPGINAMTFSPDGKYLATVDTSHARVWDVTHGQEVARRRNHQFARTLAFSPDARTLFISGSERSQRWDWQADDLILSACGRLSRNLTLAEWRQYMGTEQYRKTCRNLP